MADKDWWEDAEGAEHNAANAVARAAALEVTLGQLRGDMTMLTAKNADLEERNTSFAEIIHGLAHAECDHDFPTVYVAITLSEEGIGTVDVTDHPPILVGSDETVFVTNINSGICLRWTPPHEPGGNSDDCRIPNCPQCRAAEKVNGQ